MLDTLLAGYAALGGRPSRLRSLAGLLAALALISLAPGAATGATRELASPNEQADGLFGYAVASFPDLNGDAISEAVVATHLETVLGVNHAGRVYIFSGATGSVVRQFQSPSPQMQGLFGSSLAVLPDVTGDGFPDLAIGEDIDPGVAPGSGRVHIFNAANSTLIRTLQSPSPEADGRFGYTIAAAPDLNDDGRGDIAVGAWGEDGGLSDAGRVYIFSGATGALLHTVQSLNATVGGRFGISLAGLPDLSGDGRGDLIAGAPRENGGVSTTGRAYVINGFTGAIIRTLNSPNEEVAGRFSVDVDSVPDLTGDGTVELLVGANDEDAGGTDTGRVYVFSGATGGLYATLTIPNPKPDDAKLGLAVSSTADIDGDGLSEILAGAVLEDVSFDMQGRLHVFSGGTGAHLFSVDTPNPEVMGEFSYSVAGMPDLNADGRGDVLVGAHLEDPPLHPNDCGRAYLFTLSTPTPMPTPSPTPGPPAIELQPVSQDANIGDNVAFHVGATGEGPLTYQWKRGGFDVIGEQTPVLNVTNVQLPDHGTVQVIVSSPWGDTPSDLVTLTVHSPSEPNAAQFIGTSAPAIMFAGQGCWVGVTMRNSSQLTWGLEQGYSLGVVQDPGLLLLGETRFPLIPSEHIVAKGAQYQFVAYVQPPAAPGPYFVQLRMVEELVEFFGDTVTLSIQVIPGPNGAADWRIYE